MQKVRAVHSVQLSSSLIRHATGHLKGQETRSPRQVRPPYHSTESVWANIALAFHSTCPTWRSTRRFSPNDNYASFFNDLPRLFNPTYVPSTDVRSSLLRHKSPPVFRFPTPPRFPLIETLFATPLPPPHTGHHFRPCTHNGYPRDALYDGRSVQEAAGDDRRRWPEIRATQVDPLFPGCHGYPVPRLAQRVRSVPHRRAKCGTCVPAACRPPGSLLRLSAARGRGSRSGDPRGGGGKLQCRLSSLIEPNDGRDGRMGLDMFLSVVQNHILGAYLPLLGYTDLHSTNLRHGADPFPQQRRSVQGENSVLAHQQILPCTTPYSPSPLRIWGLHY